jgi:hypothetical protein
MMINSRASLAVVAAVAFSGVLGFGQGSPKVVEAKVALATNGVHAGSTARAAVVGRVTTGFHINDHHPTLDYLIPTEVELQKSADVTLERIVYPKGRPLKFSFSDVPLSVYEGEVPIGLLFRVSKSVASRTISLSGKFSYQACNDHASHQRALLAGVESDPVQRSSAGRKCRPIFKDQVQLDCVSPLSLPSRRHSTHYEAGKGGRSVLWSNLYCSRNLE